jgi:hypothetical protein
MYYTLNSHSRLTYTSRAPIFKHITSNDDDDDNNNYYYYHLLAPSFSASLDVVNYNNNSFNRPVRLYRKKCVVNYTRLYYYYCYTIRSSTALGSSDVGLMMAIAVVSI